MRDGMPVIGRGLNASLESLELPRLGRQVVDMVKGITTTSFSSFERRSARTDSSQVYRSVVGC